MLFNFWKHTHQPRRRSSTSLSILQIIQSSPTVPLIQSSCFKGDRLTCNIRCLWVDLAAFTSLRTHVKTNDHLGTVLLANPDRLNLDLFQKNSRSV